jgi:hypothetical protein
MARLDPFAYRLRRFRVAVVTAVALPWVVELLLVPFYGWNGSALRNAILVAVDALLVFFAWRRPDGLATILIIVRLSVGAAMFLWFGSGLAFAYGVLTGVAAVVLLALLVPMWTPLRRERLQVRKERQLARLRRLDESTSVPDRRAFERQQKIEERGYL